MAMRMRSMLLPGAFTQTGQTPAVKALIAQTARGPVRRKKRPAKKRAVRRKTAKKRTRRAAPKGRLKKGSPAAKRRMAQLRAMQKRKRR
jgi:hypothetical protein